MTKVQTGEETSFFINENHLELFLHIYTICEKHVTVIWKFGIFCFSYRVKWLQNPAIVLCTKHFISCHAVIRVYYWKRWNMPQLFEIILVNKINKKHFLVFKKRNWLTMFFSQAWPFFDNASTMQGWTYLLGYFSKATIDYYSHHCSIEGSLASLKVVFKNLPECSRKPHSCSKESVWCLTTKWFLLAVPFKISFSSENGYFINWNNQKMRLNLFPVYGNHRSFTQTFL